MYLGSWLVTRGVFVGIIVLVVFASVVTTGASFPSTSQDSDVGFQNIGDQNTSSEQHNVSNDAANAGDCRVSGKYPPEIMRWCGLITRYADKFGLDPDLVAALIWQESGGKPLAYSKSGAVGLMQVMPRDGKAASFRCKNGPCFANRPTIKELQNPEYNVKYGTRMLARLKAKHGGLREALKAYGPMNVGYYYADKVIGIYQKYGS